MVSRPIDGAAPWAGLEKVESQKTKISKNCDLKNQQISKRKTARVLRGPEEDGAGRCQKGFRQFGAPRKNGGVFF